MDRTKACLLGGAIGDALGAPIEFASTAQIAALHPGPVTTYLPMNGTAGLVTDDTQMTLFTAEGIIRAEIRFTQRGICNYVAVVDHAYQRWLTTQLEPAPPTTQDADDSHFTDGWLGQQQWLYARRAPGLTCLSALEETRGTLTDQPAKNNSKGCGAVMRSAPFGLIRIDDPSFALESAALTHGHPTGQVAAAALAFLIRAIMETHDLGTSISATFDWLTQIDHHQETFAALKAATTATNIEQLGEGWIAEEAFAMGVFAALQYPRPEHMLEALALAVTHGGDSDSTGSIAGNILGALHGTEALPAHLLEHLEGKDAIERIASDLATITHAPHEVFTYNIEPHRLPEPSINDEWWESYPGW